MDSVIETQRASHEEIERYEQALADVLMQQPVGQRNLTRRDRKAAEILARIGELRHNLTSLYEDAPGLRPIELAALSAPPGGEGVDELAEFYSRFEKVKDFHRKNTGLNARELIMAIDDMVHSDGVQTIEVEGEDEAVEIDPLENVFSGEEAFGRHLDLYEAHAQFLNLKGSTRLSYIGYLDMMKSGRVERTLDVREKSHAAYLQYVQTLYSYLTSFFERALPLIDIEKKLKEEEEAFDTAWAAGEVEGWDEGSAAPSTDGGIWCAYCARSYAKQTVYDAHLSSAKHKKKEAAGVKVAQGDTAPSSSTQGTGKDKLRPAARLTWLVCALLVFPPIPEKITASRGEVERRAALTAREREAELEDVEEAAPVVLPPPGEEDDDEDDARVYNPLNLPLGWDGKPIPFWLYKLHGLGVEFKCEICSDHVYMGRKAFDRHFQESRHAFGMRALGLPNTRHFHEITKINDALALAEKLKAEGRAELSAMDKAEEFEDDEGNVYDKKTYEDLKRQGLL